SSPRKPELAAFPSLSPPAGERAGLPAIASATAGVRGKAMWLQQRSRTQPPLLQIPNPHFSRRSRAKAESQIQNHLSSIASAKEEKSTIQNLLGICISASLWPTPSSSVWSK